MSGVLCKNYYRIMVSRVIFSRSISGGWGWRIGGGKPISNCCPFCLSEHWDADTQPSSLRGGGLMKLLSIPLTLIMFTLLVGVFHQASSALGGLVVIEWVGVIIAFVATYKFGRWFVN